MFESAELGHKIGKTQYKREAPKLRAAVLEAQYAVKEAAQFPVVILINGVDGAGKGETVNLLNEWMDPRLVVTRAFGPRSEHELLRPDMWRFWRALPPRGRVGILFGSWYTQPILDRVSGSIRAAELEQRIERIVQLENMLTQEGALLLKFWFHLSKDKQKKRLRELESSKATRWRVTRDDWRNFRKYEEFRGVSEHVLRQTSTGHAPWIIVEGADPEFRALTVGRAIVSGIGARIGDKKSPRVTASEAPPLVAPVDSLKIIDRLDLTQSLPKASYERELEKWQGRLNLLLRDRRMADHAVVAAFEGNDAAGKGGAIRRVTGALDARQYDVVPVAAPTDEERAQPYLWRFWRNIPRKGRLTVFDRSWYGRVLVERVEGFCAKRDWMRAYAELNAFEEELTQSGVVVVKFWLAISKSEQLKRFRERERVKTKQFKITAEDWRNREKWGAYADAVNDMVERTSTSYAPWTLVEANDKYFARIKVLKTLAKSIERAFDGD